MHAPNLRSEFSKIVSSVSDYYGQVMETLPKLADNAVVQKAKEISTTMRNISHDVATWSKEISEVAGTVAKLPLPESVKKMIKDVGSVATDVGNVAVNIESTINGLWQKAEAAVAHADQLNDRAKALRATFEDENTTLQQKEKNRAELKAIESQLSREKASIENTLGGVRAGFQAAGIIVGLFGNKELASDIVAVGEAGVTIASSIATLVAGSVAGGPAMPVIAIAGAVTMLASRLFGGGGPTKEEIILQSINRLSRHMDQRFDRIEVMIKKSVEYLAEHIDRRFIALGEHIDNRFNHIEETLQYMYKDMLEQFAKLHENQADHLTTLQAKIDGLREAIDYLHTDMVAGIRALYAQNYQESRNSALTAIARNEISVQEHRHYYQTIAAWAKDDVKQETLSGNERTADLVERVLADGANVNINKIRRRAIQLAGNSIQDNGRLVNPAVWAEGVRTLIAYFAITPELYRIITPNQVLLSDIQAIQNEGLRFLLFIRSLQKNQQLFERLINNYKAALINVLKKINALTVTSDNAAVVASSSPESALMIVTAIEVCDSFIQSEIYPAGQNLPNLGRLDSITNHQRYEHPFPESRILSQVTQQVTANVANYHNPRQEGLVHAAENGVVGTFPWAFSPSNLNSPIHDWNALNTHYTAKFDEARAVREAYIELHNFVRDSHLRDLKDNANYRNDRVSAILSHHAVLERDRTATSQELPHCALMEKYFSIQDKNALNATLTANQNLTGTLLNNLQKAYEELIIFIGFAFPRQFTGDPHLRAFLDTLWDKSTVEDYIRQGATNRDFVAVALQKFLEPERELEQFKKYIFEIIADASIASTNGCDNEQYSHPLVEKILGELKEFERSAKLATRAQQTSHAKVRVFHPLGSYKEIAGNGNCFFSAVAYHLANPRFNSSKLRAAAVAYMRAHKDIFLVAFEGNENAFNQYIAKMSKEGAWADGPVIAALAMQQNLRLLIIDDQVDQRTQQRRYAFIEENAAAERVIYLLRVNNNHYQAFLPDEQQLTQRTEYQARITDGLFKLAAGSIESLSQTAKELKEDLEFLTTILADMPASINDENEENLESLTRTPADMPPTRGVTHFFATANSAADAPAANPAPRSTQS